MNEKETPKVFALTRDDDEPDQIVGYGMVLPDGSAYSVSWPAKAGTWFWSGASADEIAAIRGTEVLWMGDQP
jgi:hypothetical protein